jgi:hypothetical protein
MWSCNVGVLLSTYLHCTVCRLSFAPVWFLWYSNLTQESSLDLRWDIAESNTWSLNCTMLYFLGRRNAFAVIDLMVSCNESFTSKQFARYKQTRNLDAHQLHSMTSCLSEGKMLQYRLDRCRSYSAASRLLILRAVPTQMDMSRPDVITSLSDWTTQTSTLKHKVTSGGYKATDQTLQVVFTVQ